MASRRRLLLAVDLTSKLRTLPTTRVSAGGWRSAYPCLPALRQPVTCRRKAVPPEGSQRADWFAAESHDARRRCPGEEEEEQEEDRAGADSGASGDEPDDAVLGGGADPCGVNPARDALGKGADEVSARSKRV